MKVLSKWMLLVAMMMTLSGLTGCVAQSETDRQRQLIRKYEEQILELQSQLEEARNRIAYLQANPARDPAQAAEIERLRGEINRLNAALAQAEEALRQPTPPTQITTMLTPELDRALRDLAARNPDLMEYDAARGMVRFKSDLTFDSGSTTIRQPAQAALRQLAGVLNSSEAQPYDVRVVGHTDNVPVRQIAGRRFTNNWELSAFRAISVKDALTAANVSQSRVEIAGRGEHHPVVANTAQGAEPNRRVEIFLVQAVRPSAPQGQAAPRQTQPTRTTPAPAQESDAQFK